MNLRGTSTAAVLLSLSLTACGTAGKSSSSPAAGASGGFAPRHGAVLPQPELKADGDQDSDSYVGEADNDDNHVFGHAASASAARAVTRLVKRYYAAAATGDGALACRLLYSTLAESVAKDYGQASGGSNAHPGSCAATASKVFTRIQRQLSSDSATLQVAAVRVRHREASAQMSFTHGKPTYYLLLRLERGAWKVDNLFGSEQAIYIE